MHNTFHTPQSSWTRTLLLTLAVASAFTVLGRATRQDDGAGRAGRGPARLSGFSIFSALETDGQDGLSPAEIERAPAVLRALDKNGDGQLTPDEFPVAGRGRGFPGRGGPGGFPGRGFEGGPDRGGRGDGPGGPGEAAPTSPDELTSALMAFDQNKDGKLTRAEVPERFQGLFDRVDANKDGVITPDEIRKSAQAQAQTQSADRGREGREGRDGREGGRDGGPFGGGPDPLVTALDVNGDGVLSADEIASVSTVLRRFDRNGDGVVTMEEVFGGGRGRG